MQAHLKEKGRKIVFIHGKGDGTLRAALLKELRSRYKQCAVQDASFREYGFGATMVTIR
jgi:dsDNA-specific endonuclease/ATPase MutS2